MRPIASTLVECQAHRLHMMFLKIVLGLMCFGNTALRRLHGEGTKVVGQLESQARFVSSK